MVFAYPCGGYNQDWSFRPQYGGTYSIYTAPSNPNPNKCLGVAKNGQNLVFTFKDCDDSLEQNWFYDNERSLIKSFVGNYFLDLDSRDNVIVSATERKNTKFRIFK